MTDHMHAMIVIAVMGLAVLATRIVPVLIFGRGEKVPEFIIYLGRVVPYTAMGLLIVYCLKGAKSNLFGTGIPGIAAVLVVAVSYKWKHHTFISIIAGTAVYLVMLRMM